MSGLPPRSDIIPDRQAVAGQGPLWSHEDVSCPHPGCGDYGHIWIKVSSVIVLRVSGGALVD